MESMVLTLISNCSLVMGNQLRPNDRIKYGVGGVLAEYEYAAVGLSDTVYSTLDGQNRFVTEVKTARSFLSNDLWYRKSRASQTLHPMYFTFLPMLLVSQRQFKLVFEPNTRDCVYAYPGDERLSTAGNTFSDEFLHVLGLLILSKRQVNDEMRKIAPMTPVKSSLVNRVVETQKKPQPKRTATGSTSSRPRKRKADTKANETELEEDEMRPIWFLSSSVIEQVLGKDPSSFEQSTLLNQSETEELKQIASEK